MDLTLRLAHTTPDLIEHLADFDDEDLDELEFGVIGVDGQGIVRRYNRFQSQLGGMSRDRVIGQPLFTTVAPCMNNFMIAQHFEDALRNGTPLDHLVDWVFTLRMRPSKVCLRLLSRPGLPLRYVAITRRA